MKIIALNVPRSNTSGRFVPIPPALVAFYLISLALDLNFLGVQLALIGGWPGGFIGRRWVIKPAES